MEAIKYVSSKNPKLENTPPYFINRLARLFRVHLIKKLGKEPVDLTPEQYTLLLNIYGNGGQSQKDLADPILNDHPNITRLLDSLEENEYIQRAPDPKDRRKFSITLSNKGKKVVRELFRSRIEEIKFLFKGFSRSDVDQLNQLLSRLEKNIVDRLEFYS